MTGSPLDMPVGAAMVAVALLVSILLLTAWTADAHDRARRRRKHDWIRIGYGGCGWSLYRCTLCGKEDIDA